MNAPTEIFLQLFGLSTLKVRLLDEPNAEAGLSSRQRGRISESEAKIESDKFLSPSLTRKVRLQPHARL